jgi:pimeloyl-ACP methyl ester carboxylesterase
VVGVSLGGMIAQLLALRHRHLVRSLTSIMSTTGSGQVGQPTEAALALLLSAPPTTRDEVLDRAVLSNRTMGSPAYPADEGEIRERAGRAYDRAYDPPGVAANWRPHSPLPTEPTTSADSTCRRWSSMALRIP